MMNIVDNIRTIRDQIAAACTRSDRTPEDVRLVAVSKTKPAEMINQACQAGQQIFGESYVQDFLDKADAVTGEVEWHFIGALQSNKVKYLRGRVKMIHSVDRLSLAKEIERQWTKIDRSIDVLLQVNISEEATKSGASEAGLVELVRGVAQLPHLKIRGLMTLPPYCDDPEAVRPYFRHLRELAETIDRLAIPGVEMKELSMGMSHDFEVAVEEGATLVRVGTAIFGERIKR